MRTWLVVGGSCVLLAMSCMRDNPEFMTGSETGVESESEVSGDSQPPPEESGEEEGGVCDAAPGVSGLIEVVQICTPDEEGVYDRWFLVDENIDNAVGCIDADLCVRPCGMANCADSGNTPCGVLSPLVVEPFEVAELAVPGDCIHVRARKLAGADDCEYHAITIEVDGDGGPELVLAGRIASDVAMPMSPANPAAAGFNPELEEPSSCACDDFPDTCCEGKERTEWQYEVDGELVPIGEQSELTLGGQDFTFHAYNAYDSGECDAPREIVWALTAN